MTEIIKQSGNRFKVRDSQGKVRFTERDIEGIKRGDYLQPNVPQEKDRYIQTYGRHPDESPADILKYLKRRGMSKKFNPAKY